MTFPYNEKFLRTAKLISVPGLDRMQKSHVMVIGMGGVGSWAAEALARSGVGKLTLVDFDVVSATNFNRQLSAVEPYMGQPKVTSVAGRIKDINPECETITKQMLVNLATIPDLLASKPDFVIDAIDQLGNKCALLDYCHKQGIKVVSSTGAGGKIDPTKIRAGDLADSQVDNLARHVRAMLRRRHGFPRTGAFGIHAVYSTEQVKAPLSIGESAEDQKHTQTVAADSAAKSLKSDQRNVVMGTVTFVTASFGMACASVVVRELLLADGIDIRN